MYSRIRDLREDADLNQSQMAAILGMSKPVIPNMKPEPM